MDDGSNTPETTKYWYDLRGNLIKSQLPRDGQLRQRWFYCAAS